MGTVQRQMKSLSTSGAFIMGVFAGPFDTSLLVRLGKIFKSDTRKVHRGFIKSKTLVMMLFRSGGVSLGDCCPKNLTLKMGFARTTM